VAPRHTLPVFGNRGVTATVTVVLGVPVVSTVADAVAVRT